MIRRKINNQYKYPSEVFATISKLESFHDRSNYLKQNSSFAIKTILQLNFNDNIVLDLPEGAPDFTRETMPPDKAPARIDNAIKTLGRLVKTNNEANYIQKLKKQKLFMNLIESVNEKDADIIIAAKDKSLEKIYPMVDRTLVKSVFPEIL